MSNIKKHLGKASVSSIKITSACDDRPPDGTILFPKSGEQPPGRVVVKIGGKNRVLTAGMRSDSGTGACVSGSLLASVGGSSPEISWRKGRLIDIYLYDSKKLFGIVVAILAVIASIVLAVFSFIVNSSSTDAATKGTAAGILALTVINAILTFITSLSA
jgi:hypothetical protein